MDSLFKALADPNRRKILSLLKKGDLTVGEIQVHFKITPASLSHHLAELKRAHLVVPQREGQFIRYSLNLSVFEQVTQLFLNLFSK